VANEWGPALDGAAARGFHSLLLAGHPGKLAKLALGHWDTHSARSPSPVPGVAELVRAVTGQAPEPATTVEGLLLALAPGVRTAVGARLALAIREAAQARSGRPCAVALCGMDGLVWAVDGEGTPWA
jgi:cobalt-precorrin-5B (C1)-methyltransferase